MSKLNIYGVVELEVFDGTSTQTFKFPNLITNEGIKYLFYPSDTVFNKTFFALGYSSDQVSEDVSTIPDNFIETNFDFVQTKSPSSVSNIITFSKRLTSAHLANDFKVNTLQLCGYNTNGDKVPLTCVKLLDKDANLYTYTHSSNTVLTIHYSLTVLFTVTNNVSTSDRLEFIFKEGSTWNTDVNVKDLKPNTYRQGRGRVELLETSFTEQGELRSSYKVDINKSARTTNINVGAGTIVYHHTSTTPNTVKLDLHISRYTKSEQAPKPVERVEVDTSNKVLSIYSSPNQWVFFKHKETTDGNETKPAWVYIDSTGVAKYSYKKERDDFYQPIEDGEVIEFITINAYNERTSILLETVDNIAKPLKILYFINERTIRAVGEFKDSVQLKNVFYENVGEPKLCTTPSTDYSGYFYTDITLPEGYNIYEKPILSYKVIDKASNELEVDEYDNNIFTRYYGTDQITVERLKGLTTTPHALTTNVYSSSYSSSLITICTKAEII